MKILGALLAACFCSVHALAGDQPRLPDSQLLYSHNSYLATDTRWRGMALQEQLNAGIRILEFDILDGRGRVAHDHREQEQHCYSVEDCLGQVDLWSSEHPDHGPVVALFEIHHSVERQHGEPTVAEAVETVRGKVDALLGAVAPLSRRGRLVTYAQSLQPVKALRGKLLIGVYRKFNTQVSHAQYRGASPRRSLAIGEALGLVSPGDADGGSDYAAAMLHHSLFLVPRWLGEDSHGVADRDWLAERLLRRRFASQSAGGKPLRLVKQDDWSYESEHRRAYDFFVAHFFPMPEGTDVEQVLRQHRVNGLGVNSASTFRRRQGEP